jgi:hypothetical protein
MTYAIKPEIEIDSEEFAEWNFSDLHHLNDLITKWRHMTPPEITFGTNKQEIFWDEVGNAVSEALRSKIAEELKSKGGIDMQRFMTTKRGEESSLDN